MQTAPLFRDLRWPRHIIVLILIQAAAGYIVMDWNTDQFFGPDGPWQAVLMEVNSERVSLVPAGSLGMSEILSRDVCESPNVDSTCAIGGTIENRLPRSNASDEYFNVSNGEFSASFQVNGQSPFDISRTYNISKAPIRFGGLDGVFAYRSSATIGVVSDCAYKYPNGKTVTPQLGLFNMGGQMTEVKDALCPQETCNTVWYLYKQNWIKSAAWTLHIGSASLGYPGSLVLGGYDRGRAIGPIVDAWLNLGLIDVTIGVETGRSPFGLISQEGLLMTDDNDIAVEPVLVNLDTVTPYIFLPHATVDAITRKLPVYFDDHSKYYLWNTTDPSYVDVVTSPSYLGFVFPGEAGSNVTIKVPFALLNLTLQPGVSGLQTDVTYLPLLGADKSQFDGASGPGTALYPLGKAFLQSVFLFGQYTNPQSPHFYFAQAPGPGVSGGGLAYEILDIGPNTTKLDVYEGDNLFNETWAGWWTPLYSTTADSPGGLSKAEEAGIAVGVAAAGCVAFIAGFFTLRKRRRTHRGNEERKQDTKYFEHAEMEDHNTHTSRSAELLGDEKHTKLNQRSGLFTSQHAAELHAPHGASEVAEVTKYELDA